MDTSWSVHLYIPELIPSGLLMPYQAISLYCGDMPERVNNKLDQLPQKLPVKQYTTTTEVNPLTPVSANWHFTLSNARRFYSSMEHPSGVKGLSPLICRCQILYVKPIPRAFPPNIAQNKSSGKKEIVRSLVEKINSSDSNHFVCTPLVWKKRKNLQRLEVPFFFPFFSNLCKYAQ